jgi:hypothetical protein
MTDTEAALRCCAIYDRPEYFDAIFDIAGVYVGFKFIAGNVHLICRGSLTWLDWFRDGESIETVEHPVLGTVGKGFIDGVDAIYAVIKKKLPFRSEDLVFLEGHSLGCAHGEYLAGLLVNDGMHVELSLFEPPQACGPKLVEMLARYPVRPYANCGSSIPYMPSELAQPRRLINVSCPPVAADLTPFRYHHMPLLYAAVSYAALSGDENGPVAGK